MARGVGSGRWYGWGLGFGREWAGVRSVIVVCAGGVFAVKSFRRVVG